MAKLSKDFLKERSSQYKDIRIEEFDLDCKIKRIPVKLALELTGIDEQNVKSQTEAMVDCIIECCLDDDLNKLFTKSDRNMWLDQEMNFITKLFMEITAFSGMNESVDNLIDEQAKN